MIYRKTYSNTTEAFPKTCSYACPLERPATVPWRLRYLGVATAVVAVIGYLVAVL